MAVPNGQLPSWLGQDPEHQCESCVSTRTDPSRHLGTAPESVRGPCGFDGGNPEGCPPGTAGWQGCNAGGYGHGADSRLPRPWLGGAQAAEARAQLTRDVLAMAAVREDGHKLYTMLGEALQATLEREEADKKREEADKTLAELYEKYPSLKRRRSRSRSRTSAFTAARSSAEHPSQDI